MPIPLRHLTDGAALLDLGNEAALDLAAALAARPPPGFLDAVPGARTLLVITDPQFLPPERLGAVLEGVGAAGPRPAPRTHRLRTSYGGADGPDLEELARAAAVPADELARLHAQAVHTVAFLGFAPGFAYLSGAPPALTVPRLKTPRLRVPPGSVAVADGYTGIYPAETPGGWRLIGRVAVRLFDPAASPPSLFLPGDRVVFEPVPAHDLGAQPSPVAPAPSSGMEVLRLLSPGSFTTVQGGPRFGLSASGVPSGGAMDLASLAIANQRLGNAPLAAALEITLAGPEILSLERTRVALGGGETSASLDGVELHGPGPHSLEPGARLKIGPLRRGVRAYLGVEGGLALPPPGTNTFPLRREQTIRRASEPPAPAPHPPPAPPRIGDAEISVRALSGPQWDFFTPASRATFFSATWELTPQSDRRGLRLRGPPLELSRPSDIPSEGTAPGAVQVPGDGLPIVLGPDRPVTGGYAKIATLVSNDLPLLAQARPGTRIRFREATLAEALAARRGAT